MAERYKVPPLTAGCLLPLPRFESRHVGKLPVTWCYSVIFIRYSDFLHYLQMACHELATIRHKCDEKRNSKDFRSCYTPYQSCKQLRFGIYTPCAGIHNALNISVFNGLAYMHYAGIRITLSRQDSEITLTTD